MTTAPASPEVAVHELTVRLMKIGARAMSAGGHYIDRANVAPWWNPLERYIRHRERTAVLAAIATMLGEEAMPDA